MTLLDAILTAIVEGLTEFLPISSTGHMILLNYLLGNHEDAFTSTFEIVIQLGAIMAIVLLYAKRFIFKFDIYLKLFVAFLPSAVLGALFYKIIKTYLFNHWVVATSLIIGGIILILLDKRMAHGEQTPEELDNISYKQAFFIGCFQCISMIPGVSRAAATIIGGMFNGLSKKSAAEFSFLLAIPTMIAASAKDLYEFEGTITNDQWTTIAIGFVVAFVTAIFAVKWFVKLLEKHGFTGFGWYRIVIGVLFLLFAWSQL
ncbi:MAG: undecaprenyl-diphosphate phosphatase [Saprospiraceae bacterium]|jgi:undecaprenyl-diphosphatase|nr:undecaprenyl-diphosphate phosphatase [Saprospiraceae bacterium]